MDLLSNLTTGVAALASRGDPGTLAIIGFMLQPLFIYGSISGLKEGDTPPPDRRGKPWTFSLATGLDGTRPGGDLPLTDAGGPVPEISLFNDQGEHLGTSKGQGYAGINRATIVHIYPRDIIQHEGQYATFVFLTAKGQDDPLCIVDMTLIGPNDEEKSRRGFGAVTPRTCGFPWYYSGVHRESPLKQTPCFWLGGFGTEAMQMHMPSHTFGQTDVSVGKLNETTECSHDWFCNRPAIMQRFNKRPATGQAKRLLVTDREMLGDRTFEQTLKMHQKGQDSWKESGLGDRSSRVTRSHEDTLTIAHQLEGLSAIELCEDALSAGPDYVNIVEGKFCRMSDKTLWPTCDHQTQVGPRDDCFDVDSKQLVIGGKMTRSKPYSKEINFPLKN